MAEVLPVTFIPQKDVLPRQYVMHVHTIICAACLDEQVYTEVYAQNEMMARTGTGKPVRHLVPIQSLEYNLPIAIEKRPFRTIPICTKCVGLTDLSAKPDPRTSADWKRQYAPDWVRLATPTEPSKGSKRQPPKTIDDLLNI